MTQRNEQRDEQRNEQPGPQPDEPRYPFYRHAREWLRLPGGRPVDDLSVESIRDGAVGPGDLGIHPETLEAQARAALRAGFPQLAENLRRAAELVRVPDGRILAIYDALRPGRSTPEELEAIARELEERFDAPRTARFVREAAAALGGVRGDSAS